jgi:hypothetical protein
MAYYPIHRNQNESASKMYLFDEIDKIALDFLRYLADELY